MKKQIKRLSLNKKTISNLNAAEMNRHIGGTKGTYTCSPACITNKGKTWCNGNTCAGHNTCQYTCI